MTKLSQLFKNWHYRKKRAELSPTNVSGSDLAPNKILRPLAHQQWQLVGNLLEFSETSKMHNPKNAFIEFFYRFSRSFAGVFGFVILATLIVLSLIIEMCWSMWNPSEMCCCIVWTEFVFEIIGIK